MNASRNIELNVKLELKDYLRASYWYLFHKSWFWIVVAIAILNLSFFVTQIAQNPTGNIWLTLIIPTAAVATLVNVYFGAKRSMASNKSLQGNIHYIFSGSGVDAVAQSSSGHTGWDNILSVNESRHNFLLFISHNQMYTIPKRCFDSKEQERAFREMIQSNMGGKARFK